MNKYKLNDNVDLKELEKFNYIRTGGTEEEHYHWGEYVKVIDFIFKRPIIIMIPFRNEHKNEIIIDYYNNYRKIPCMSYDRPKLKRKYIKDLIKADLVEKIEE